MPRAGCKCCGCSRPGDVQLDGQMDEFTGTGAQASQLCPLCPGQGRLTLHAPFQVSPKPVRPRCPQGSTPAWRRPELPSTLRKHELLPTPAPAQILNRSEVHDLPTTHTRWARPVPAGCPQPGQAEEGMLPDRSLCSQTHVHRPLAGHSKRASGEAEPRQLPGHCTLCSALGPWSQS